MFFLTTYCNDFQNFRYGKMAVGVSLYYLWFPGAGGGGGGGGPCIYFLLGLGEGVIQNLDEKMENREAKT